LIKCSVTLYCRARNGIKHKPRPLQRHPGEGGGCIMHIILLGRRGVGAVLYTVFDLSTMRAGAVQRDGPDGVHSGSIAGTSPTSCTVTSALTVAYTL
jgi:hypothetical protein